MRSNRRLPWLSLAFAGAATLLAALAAAVFVGLGGYDVSATRPHTQAVYSLLEWGLERSVRVRARHLTEPAIADAGAASRGASCYRAHCLGCHGAPGIAPNAFALSMQPVPGPLVDASAQWNRAEVYWITRHGIRMTGMPAWQERLDDADLWAVAAFVMRLGALAPVELDAAWRDGGADDACVRSDPPPRRPPDARRGRHLFTQYGCHGCHRIEGVVGPFVHVGPALGADRADATLPRGLVRDHATLVRWLRDPASIAPGSAMPALGVGAADAADMAAWLGGSR